MPISNPSPDVDQDTQRHVPHKRALTHQRTIPQNTQTKTQKRQGKDKDPTAHKTEVLSKIIPTVKPCWARQQSKHQAPTINVIDKSLSPNRPNRFGHITNCSECKQLDIWASTVSMNLCKWRGELILQGAK